MYFCLMQRYAFQIQYHGKNYFGWQRQLGQISVQERIEKTIQKLYNQEDIDIVGCGRTDTGVHAHDYVFHVDLEERYAVDELQYKLNKMFPEDIAILSLKKVESSFHARFDAKKRTYRYFLHQQKNPFKNDISLFFPSRLDFDKMNQACNYLIGKQDFTSLSKLHTDVKTNICDVTKAQWIKTAEHECYFEIAADRFLRNMVRATVGTLLEVGTGKISPQDVKSILEAKNRSEAKLSVAAHGLFLWEIVY